MNLTKSFTTERPAQPAKFYAANQNELAAVGADAFGQNPALFAAQVAERFERSHAAQIVRDDGRRIVGFALHDILQTRHWQPAFN
jgi:hypothetical protein